MSSVLLLLLILFLKKGLANYPYTNWPQTQDPLASTSQVAGLQACTTMPGKHVVQFCFLGMCICVGGTILVSLLQHSSHAPSPSGPHFRDNTFSLLLNVFIH
jgi:hypothetical protein